MPKYPFIKHQYRKLFTHDAIIVESPDGNIKYDKKNILRIGYELNHDSYPEREGVLFFEEKNGARVNILKINRDNNYSLKEEVDNLKKFLEGYLGI